MAHLLLLCSLYVVGPQAARALSVFVALSALENVLSDIFS